jgi:magnesium chelatase subunit I
VGLLEEANNGILYVDEINLLDDHIVNILLDVTSTGILVVQRQGSQRETEISFTLVGTMNPEEGGLRAQLQDRFGLMAAVRREADLATRVQILGLVLDFDDEAARRAKEADAATKKRLHKARRNLDAVACDTPVREACVELAEEFQVDGHRGEYNVALAARALAAAEGDEATTLGHVARVARLALEHRRRGGASRESEPWSPEDEARVRAVLHRKGLAATGPEGIHAAK